MVFVLAVQVIAAGDEPNNEHMNGVSSQESTVSIQERSLPISVPRLSDGLDGRFHFRSMFSWRNCSLPGSQPPRSLFPVFAAG